MEEVSVIEGQQEQLAIVKEEEQQQENEKEKQITPPEGIDGTKHVENLFSLLKPTDLKKILDKVSGRHRRRHSWTQSSEQDDTDSESRFVTPLHDHDELTRCMECGRKHTTPNGLFWHLDVKHKWSFQLTRLKATRTCPICGVFCGHWYNMSLHVIEAHGQRNWWKEHGSIMLIQPAQAELEEEVTKLDKPDQDRRLSIILSSSLDRHYPTPQFLTNEEQGLPLNQRRSSLAMHDSVDTMLMYGSTVLPEKIDEEINSPFEDAEACDISLAGNEQNDSPKSIAPKHGDALVSVEKQSKKVSGRGLSFRFWGDEEKQLIVKSGSLPQPIAS